MESKKTKVYILDSSSLIGGVNPADLKEDSVISPLVINETTRNPMIQIRIRSAIEEKKLTVRQPSIDSLGRIRETAKNFGENTLSKADLDILALALDLKREDHDPILISDDYSVENICEFLKIKYDSLITRGIGKLFKWIYYCRGCRRKSLKHGVCPVCGETLKRKPQPTRIVKYRKT